MATDDLSVIIAGILETSKEQITKEVSKAQRLVDQASKGITIPVTVDSAEIARGEKGIQKLIQTMNELNRLQVRQATTRTGNDANQYAELGKQIDTLRAKYNAMFDESAFKNEKFVAAYQKGQNQIALANAKAADTMVKNQDRVEAQIMKAQQDRENQLTKEEQARMKKLEADIRTNESRIMKQMQAEEAQRLKATNAEYDRLIAKLREVTALQKQLTIATGSGMSPNVVESLTGQLATATKEYETMYSRMSSDPRTAGMLQSDKFLTEYNKYWKTVEITEAKVADKRFVENKRANDKIIADNQRMVAQREKDEAKALAKQTALTDKIGRSTGVSLGAGWNSRDATTAIMAMDGLENATLKWQNVMSVGGQEYQKVVASMRDSSGVWKQIQFAINTTTGDISDMNKGLVTQGDTFTGIIQKIIQWTAGTTIVFGIIGNLRQAQEELKRMDTLLTEMSKVLNITTEDFKRMGEEALRTASEFGASVSDMLNAQIAVARAGYQDIDAMSRLIVQASIAGDMTQELASKYLIASDKAWGYGGNVERLTALLDSQNQVEKLAC